MIPKALRSWNWSEVRDKKTERIETETSSVCLFLLGSNFELFDYKLCKHQAGRRKLRWVKWIILPRNPLKRLRHDRCWHRLLFVFVIFIAMWFGFRSAGSIFAQRVVAQGEKKKRIESTVRSVFNYRMKLPTYCRWLNLFTSIVYCSPLMSRL